MAAVKQRALYFTMRIAFVSLRKFTLAVTTMRRAWSGVRRIPCEVFVWLLCIFDISAARPDRLLSFGFLPLFLQVLNTLDQLLKKRNFQRWRTLNLVARYNKRLLFRCLMSMHSIMRYNTQVRSITGERAALLLIDVHGVLCIVWSDTSRPERFACCRSAGTTQMRTIKFNLAHIVDRSSKRHVLTKFRKNVNYRRILNTAASMRMLSKPALLQLAAFAWRGELDRAW